MTESLAKLALSTARVIQSEVPKRARPPDEGLEPESEQVLPFSVVRGTRGYIEKVVHQVNGCYEHGWFDACAVMIRRLVETLIIEAFEHHKIAQHIKNSQGDFLYLGDLIDKTLAETTWNLTRNTKGALPRLKNIGDRSAHSRYFTAHRKDIDKIIDDLRVVSQELVYIAHLK
jgi:hypothetical protein